MIAATSVDEALDALDRFRPDVLVSDIAMQDRDGYDLVREVRSRAPERSGKIPAVALTAYVRAEDRVRVLSAGFQMHVAKPVEPAELTAVITGLARRPDKEENISCKSSVESPRFSAATNRSTI